MVAVIEHAAGRILDLACRRWVARVLMVAALAAAAALAPACSPTGNPMSYPIIHR
ncbi:MAG: hypothetical protein SFV21_13435 [Rhodospirillaceae bacterium]|nr:hypothetical protein [Rhodospirillaceae bacterium]